MNEPPNTVNPTPPTPPPSESKFAKFKGATNYTLGIALIGCAVADAAFNPFAFISADKLLMAGLALIGAEKVKEVMK